MMSDEDKPSSDTIVSFRNATLRVRQRLILPNTNWDVKRGQNWVVMGPNGAGKTTLVRALTGEVPVVRGTIWPPDTGTFRHRFAYVSFDQHKDVLSQEDRLDAARWYSGDIYDKTTVKDFIRVGSPGKIRAPEIVDALAQLQGADLIERGIRHLSSGEMRKVLIARAILRNPDILILDEPYSGLDEKSARLLGALIDRLIVGSRPVIVVTHRPEEIPARATHILGVKGGRIVFQGPKEKILRGNHLPALYLDGEGSPAGTAANTVSAEFLETAGAAPKSLVVIKGATVKYRQKTVICQIDWSIRQGENWALVGPNGSGKTTLLSLMVGDHPQVYANEVYMFGKRRGSGESIWEIKKHIGLVSAELQLRYRKPVTALEAVISGFYDTIGLYRRPADEQAETAQKWMKRIGIASLAQRHFERLSTGHQRLTLIARALVKSPRILILDEPTQGLDPTNRKRILSAADAICSDPGVSLIFVSHLPDELPTQITRILELIPSSSGSTARIGDL